MKEILADLIDLYFGIPGVFWDIRDGIKCQNVWFFQLNPSIALSETNSEFTPENGRFPSSESP